MTTTALTITMTITMTTEQARSRRGRPALFSRAVVTGLAAGGVVGGVAAMAQAAVTAEQPAPLLDPAVDQRVTASAASPAPPVTIIVRIPAPAATIPPGAAPVTALPAPQPVRRAAPAAPAEPVARSKGS
jgi:hypothetical protein